ncbi:hypothetical protein Tco_1135373 [Tanacetum coccineum]
MYEKLGLGELKANRMSLNLLIDMPEDFRVPIILGRPFLATARAMIDVSPVEDDICYGIHDLDDEINAEAQELPANDTYDLFLLKGLEKLIGQSDLESCESFECKVVDDSDLGEPIRHIESVNTSYPAAQKTAEPNKVESEQLYSANAKKIDEKKPKLKILSQHLEYAYLHGDKSFPIIISSKFSEREKMLLLQVLEKPKRAIAWKMSDIKGISPSYCTHKILLEDDYKPVIQPQRRLNPKVQDAVKNEIVKLLDSGMIYPISDGSWVSPIHVVPKKGESLWPSQPIPKTLNHQTSPRFNSRTHHSAMTNSNTPPPPPALTLVEKLYAVHNINSLVPEKLDLQESNYSTWSYFFKRHCSNFNVLNHIDGSTSTSDPSTDE